MKILKFALNMLLMPILLPAAYLYLGYLIYSGEDESKAMRLLIWSKI